MMNSIVVSDLSTIEILEKISTILIAASTLCFSFYIYKYQLKKDDNSLKLDWYKLIIIESKFSEFFTFFNNLNITLSRFKNDQNLSTQDKSEINAKILEHLSEIRLEFISLLLAVDKMLYDCVLYQFDQLVDGITNKLVDENLNLHDETIFEIELEQHISLHKTQILKMFVDFKGKNDSHKNSINKFLNI